MAERAFRPWHLVSAELSAPTIYGPTLTFHMGAADPLLQGVAVGDRLRVSYMHRGKGALRATAVEPGDKAYPTVRSTYLRSGAPGLVLV